MRFSRSILLLLTLLACVPIAQSAEPARREDQFKAAYLFNFLKFVEWPSSVPADVLTVCFVGADGVHDTIANGIESKRAGARRLAVRRVDSPADADGCNVLYMEGRVAGRTAVAPANAPILTVSDAQAFTERGGIIELFTDNNRLRFTINVDNAQRAGLRISSNLLQLAAQVRREER